jgi:hypothetical protein
VLRGEEALSQFKISLLVSQSTSAWVQERLYNGERLKEWVLEKWKTGRNNLCRNKNSR